MRRVSHVGVVAVSIGRSNIADVVLPGSRTDHMRSAVLADPRGAVAWSFLVGSVPAVFDPLVDGAAHIVEAERIRQVSPHFRGPLCACISAIFAGGDACGRAISPPIAGPCS